MCWSVGKNSRLNFWGDKWVKGNSLRSMVKGVWGANLTINDIFQEGNWSWNLISFDLPSEVKDKI